jgi:uncharacterized protein (DUF1501 family)
MSPFTRRSFLASSLAGTGALALNRLAFANAATESRLVFVILRGGLDGLSAVPPLGDPQYAALRGTIALTRSGEGAALALGGQSLFALHPALGFLQECFAARELCILHAMATPYRERSHFDAQDVLEAGTLRPTTGWLNRALTALPNRPGAPEAGVALGANVPLVMRGAAQVASWSPTRLATLDDETLARVTDLYATDPLLARRLAEALASDAIAQEAQRVADESQDIETEMMATAGPAERDTRTRRGFNARYAETARAAGGFLKRPDGPRVAVFDTGGWDTHANEGGAQGQLAIRLRALDAGLRALQESLGPVWRQTVVLVATEFGRTAAVNGTRGTDHGTGAAGFLLGGAVAGGRVIADWPGLAQGHLLDGRDLKPTLDFRAVAKSVLRDHLGIAPRMLDAQVFPDSGTAGWVDGLVRAT